MDAYGIIRAFGLVALLVAASVQCTKIHEQMTDDEITNLFHTTRDNIPEYDVVPVRHNLYKRSDPNLRMQFNAFGKKIDTYLEPSNGELIGQDTPVWLAFTKSDGTVEYKKMRKGIVGIVAGFFNSPIDLSTVVVSEANGENPSFEGMVAGLVVRPLPERFQEATRSKRNIEDPNASRTLLETRYHVIIKSTSMEEEQKIREVERQIREASRSANKTGSSKVKRSSKEVIYPTILVSTDFKGSKTTQNDLAYYDEIMYQLAFWNGVDLRYRHVDNPKVRLRIAGIIIGQDRSATPYLHKHRFGNEVQVQAGWTDMQNYWFEMTKRPEFPVQAYDIVVTMTDYDLIGKSNDGSRMSILGLAYVRTLCQQVFDRYHAITVVNDKGGFDGILTATHELGHIMGLFHDGKRGDECDASHGFIMQPTNIVSPRNLEWSPCSLKMLSFFFREANTDCVDDPAEFHPPGPPVQRFLPGIVLDTHKQCQGRGYSWACDANPQMCTNMNCYHTQWQGFIHGWWCQDAGPAVEGTICAPDHKCIDGVCQCLSEDCIFDKTKSAV